MDRPPETRTLSDFLRVLRQHRGMVIAITLICAGVAFAFSLIREPVYEATATLSFEDPGQQSGQVLGDQSADFFPQEEAAAGAEIITREDVAKQVSAELDGKYTPQELDDRIEAEVDAESNLVTIKATGDTAEEAADIANAVAKEAKIAAREDARDFFEAQAKELEAFKTAKPGSPDLFLVSRLRQLAAVAEPAEIIRQAKVPSSPASPKPVRDTFVAAFLGLIIGIGAAFLRHSVDRRVTDPREVQKDLGLPLVGYVRSETLGMVGLAENGGSLASEADLEAFRVLRSNVDFLTKDQEIRTVAVTSPLPEEGKSTVAAWYAYANAVAGRRTILIECDFRRPVLAKRLGLKPSPGLYDHIIGKAKPADVLRSVPVEGPTAEPLPVIPAGLEAVQPAELIASQRFEHFIKQVSKAYDLVVIDCAPLLPVGDTLELLPQVDAVLLCIRIGQTTRDQAADAREAIEHMPEGAPAGLVVTGLERGSEEDYYGYYSSYAPVEKAEKVGAEG